MSAPSWFDWKQSISTPSSAARLRRPSSTSPSVVRRRSPARGSEQVQIRAVDDEHAVMRSLPPLATPAQSRVGLPAPGAARWPGPPARLLTARPPGHDAGLRRQDPVEPAHGVLLVAGHVLEDGLGSNGRRLDSKAKFIEQPLDAFGSCGRGQAHRQRDREGAAQAVGYRLAVQDRLVPAAASMPCPMVWPGSESCARSLLARPRYDLHLGPGAALDHLGHSARLDGLGTSAGICRALLHRPARAAARRRGRPS